MPETRAGALRRVWVRGRRGLVDGAMWAFMKGEYRVNE